MQNLQSRVNATFLAHHWIVKTLFHCCKDDDDNDIVSKGEIMELFTALEIYFLLLWKEKNTTFII